MCAGHWGQGERDRVRQRPDIVAAIPSVSGNRITSDIARRSGILVV